MKKILKISPWNEILYVFPNHEETIEFASEKSYGIACWDKKLGFLKAFLTYKKWKEAKFYEDIYLLNEEIKYWRSLEKWPCYEENLEPSKYWGNVKNGYVY